MTAPGRQHLHAVVGVLLGAVCLVLALRGSDAAQLRRSALDVHPAWLVAAALLLACSYVVRTTRWGLIIGAVPATRRTLLRAIGLGYLLNSVLPARVGDVARSISAARTEGRPTALVLASTVLERIVDVIALALIALLVVPAIPSAPDWVVRAGVLLGALGLAAVVVTTALGRRGVEAGDDPLGSHDPKPVRRVLRQFVSGLALVRSRAQLACIVATTALVWGIDCTFALALAHSIGMELDWVTALGLLAALGLASAAPSSPGFVGVFQAVAVAFLGPGGVSREHAILFVSLLQVLTLIVAFGVVVITARGRRTGFQRATQQAGESDQHEDRGRKGVTRVGGRRERQQ